MSLSFCRICVRCGGRAIATHSVNIFNHFNSFFSALFPSTFRIASTFLLVGTNGRFGNLLIKTENNKFKFYNSIQLAAQQ